MKKINIVIDNDFSISDQTNNIMSTFYIDYLGKSFPDNQWVDFVNTTLESWAYTVLTHKDLTDTKFPLYFFDGPYRLDIYKDKEQELIVECVNFRDIEFVELTFKCSFLDFLLALYNAIKNFNYLLYISNINHNKFEPVFNQTIISLGKLKGAIADYSKK